MITTQILLKQLRREYWALKMAYEATATNIKLTTKTLQFSTSKNACHQSGGGISFDYADNERVLLTLDTPSGANTIAKLEISGNYTDLPIVRRVPYAGGACWVVSNAPLTSGGAWQSTTYNFTVQTLVNGTLSAKMIWE